MPEPEDLAPWVERYIRAEASRQIREEAREAGTPIGDHHKWTALVEERFQELLARAKQDTIEIKMEGPE